MTQAVGNIVGRVVRRPVDKFAERRNELALTVLPCLGELGYARATLREVAGRARVSYAVLHYYFADKIDLMAHCVRLYKLRCCDRYAEVAEQRTVGALSASLVGALAETLAGDATAQRLWYDLRLESLFEPSLREDVAEIDDALRDTLGRIVERYAALSGQRIAVDPDTAYGIFDGVMAQLVLQQAAGVEGLEWVLAERVRLLMPRMLVAPGR